MIPKIINIGYAGEKNSRCIDIDIASMLELFPDTYPTLKHQRAIDTEPYIVPTTLNGNMLRWVFSVVDVAQAGEGIAQIVFMDESGNVVGKSAEFKTVVKSSLESGKDMPEAFQPWVDSVIAAKTEIDADRTYVESVVPEIRENAQTASDNASDAITARAEAEVFANNARQSKELAESYADEALLNANKIKQKAEDVAVMHGEVVVLADEVKGNAEAVEAKAQAVATNVGVASNYAESADASRRAAQTAATEATNSKNTASTYASQAKQYMDSADSAKNTAVSVSSNAEGSASDALNHKNAAESARDAAVEAKNAAVEAKEEAKGYATVAGGLENRVEALENRPVGGGGDIIQDPSDPDGGIITSGTLADIDKSLTLDNYAADAKAVGDKLSNIKEDIAGYGTRITALENNPAVDPDLELRVEKLEAAAEGNLYMFREDAEEAYEKAVPSDVMPWATMDKLGAKTIVWNQLANIADDKTATASGITWTIENKVVKANGTSTSTATIGYNNIYKAQQPKYIIGHKYFIRGCPAGGSTSTYSLRYNINGHAETGDGVVVECVETGATSGKLIVGSQYPTPVVINGYTANNLEFKINIFDLTAMFGAGNEPTAEEFRAMFPADYYPYSEPTLMSYEPKEVVNRGRNLLNFNDSAYVTGRYGLKFTVNPDGSVRIVGTPTTTTYYNVLNNISNHPEFYDILDGTSFSQSDKYDYTAHTSTNSKGETIAFSAGLSKNAQNNVFWTFRTGVSYDETRYPYIYKGGIAPYVPGRAPITTDLHPLVAKYFPDGMKSAGDVHDEIDLERGVAVKRVGIINPADAYPSLQSINNFGIANFLFTTPDSKKYTNKVPPHIISVNLNRQNTAIAETGQEGYMAPSSNRNWFIRLNASSVSTVDKFKEWCNANNVRLVYELDEPIETPIDPADLDGLTALEVEAGGSLTFTNQHGNDYRVPLPNAETFMIKLGGVSNG